MLRSKVTRQAVSDATETGKQIALMYALMCVMTIVFGLAYLWITSLV